MLDTTPAHVQIYELQMSNVEGNFTIKAKVNEVNKLNLTFLQNLCHKDLIQSYSLLKRIQINDNDKKEELPMHVIVDTLNYAQIKTKQNIRIGNREEPVPANTVFGCTIISSG